MASMKERMLAGQLYQASDPELQSELRRAQQLVERYNETPDSRRGERAELLRELLGEVGDDVVIRSPLYCDYGRHVRVGSGTFVNFGCVMLDVAPITIGPGCQIGPNVQLVTATHPLDPAARRDGWEYGRGITLAENVWLGSGAIVCPGVTIGSDTVVGAGGIVTSDLPSGVVAAGNPARILREVSESDRPGTPPSR